MHNILNHIEVTQSLEPQTITASALNSGNIDTQGAETIAVVLMVGAFADTLSGTVKIAAKIEHADDDGTGSPGAYAACTDDDVLNASGLTAGVFVTVDDPAEDEVRHAIGYRGGKRFVKVTVTPTGLTNGGPVALLTLRGNLTQRPVTNS